MRGDGTPRILVVSTVRRPASAIRGYLAAYKEAGCDEVICFPASADPGQVDLLARAALMRPAILPQLSVRRGRAAVEFYRAAFGAQEVYRVGGDDENESVVSQLAVGEASFWVADSRPSTAPSARSRSAAGRSGCCSSSTTPTPPNRRAAAPPRRSGPRACNAHGSVCLKGVARRESWRAARRAAPCCPWAPIRAAAPRFRVPFSGRLVLF